MSIEAKFIDTSLLQNLSEQAAANERLRMNYNLHASLTDQVQRLLNALEQGTHIPIHRHPDTDEVYILLTGHIKVHFYNQDKTLATTFTLQPQEGNHGIQIPAGQWHSLEVIEKGSVIFEVKQGPYRPLSGADVIQ